MISIRKVVKKFNKLEVLKGVDLEFEKGNAYALIGPNGSGKTTLIKSILGLVMPSNGDIMVDGTSIKRSWLYREKIGYMPQIGHYPDNLQIGQLFEMMKHIRSGFESLDEELYEAFDFKSLSNKRMHTLSGGTRQKVSAALAFLFNPPVLILDEPTAGLDPLAVEILKEKIIQQKQAGKLIIITSHIMSDLDDLVTHLVYMYEGNIIYNDTIDKLKKSTNEQRLGKAIAHLMNQNSAGR
jgi:Cu-processing system ATP-binding protein